MTLPEIEVFTNLLAAAKEMRDHITMSVDDSILDDIGNDIDNAIEEAENLLG